MNAIDIDTELDEAPAEPVGPPEPWRQDKNGKEYTPRKGGRGVVYRDGDETVDEALTRDAGPKVPKRPRRKMKLPKPPPPKRVELKELEAMLAELFRSPAVACAMAGDEWAAGHFTMQGPTLARNVVAAAEHNPWLRSKLEEMASGGDVAMKLLSLVGVAGAFVVYIVPPILYYTSIPAEGARRMFEVPDRKEVNARETFPPPSATAPSPNIA
jgi:hypothetical protein